PNNEDVGEYWVNITINDTIATDFTNFTLTVQGINDAPNIITEDITIATEDEFYELDYDAEDVDNTASELNWGIITNASWLAFDPINAIINGTPTNEDVGEYWVNISVSDTEYIDHSNFTLTVVNVNDPPRIITVDNITAIEDELYEIKYEAEDVDNAPYELNWDFATNAK
ncbi:MAG: hypothetical protein KAJ51_17425, partial [Thermoplasmata archaeon]|nr:hypothetical protein [Thermoplasmata archaeon]